MAQDQSTGTCKRCGGTSTPSCPPCGMQTAGPWFTCSAGTAVTRAGREGSSTLSSWTWRAGSGATSEWRLGIAQSTGPVGLQPPSSRREFERRAGQAGLHVRTGCSCNPGACNGHLGITDEELAGLAGMTEGCGDSSQFARVARRQSELPGLLRGPDEVHALRPKGALPWASSAKSYGSMLLQGQTAGGDEDEAEQESLPEGKGLQPPPPRSMPSSYRRAPLLCRVHLGECASWQHPCVPRLHVPLGGLLRARRIHQEQLHRS